MSGGPLAANWWLKVERTTGRGERRSRRTVRLAGVARGTGATGGDSAVARGTSGELVEYVTGVVRYYGGARAMRRHASTPVGDW